MTKFKVGESYVGYYGGNQYLTLTVKAIIDETFAVVTFKRPGVQYTEYTGMYLDSLEVRVTAAENRLGGNYLNFLNKEEK